MAKQTLFFTSKVELSLSSNQILIKNEDSEEIITRAIEDVKCVIIDNHSVHITVPLLIALAENNVSVVFCDRNHMPVTMLQDLESNTMQTKYIRGQLVCSIPLKKSLWQKIIQLKIRNQSNLLTKLNKGNNPLKEYYTNVRSGDSTNREGVAAKKYWHLLYGDDFVRDRNGEAPNNLLNYGYALLRSFVARAIMDSGLLPTLGIFHRNYYNGFPLADDLMEPYRPFVDETIFELYNQGVREISKEVKRSITELFYTNVKYDEISRTTYSLANIYVGENNELYYPFLL